VTGRIPGFDFIFFGAVDWSYTWQRPQQIASRLAAQGRVLYVDPVGLRALRLSDVPRALRRLRAPAAEAEGDHGVTVLSARAATVAAGLRAPAAWTARLVAPAVRRAMTSAGIDAPVLWLGTPQPALLSALDRLPARLVVYDCLDAVAAFRPDDPEVDASETALAARADLVLATTRELEARMLRYNARTLLVPNAAEVEHFARPVAPPEIPDDLRALPRPVVGYVGEVADWLDTALLGALASRRPEWSIVLVGPATAAARRALEAPNIHLLGRRPYALLPRYLAGFDCCLIPFRASPLTAAVSPIKLYEYLAAGRPVVSTPLPSVLPFAREVFVAAGPRFLEAVDEAVAGARDAAAAEVRRRRVQAETWEHRVARILGGLRTVEDARAARLPRAQAAG
jgi:glycosyltransferase involved in cell wall biosynthesis